MVFLRSMAKVTFMDKFGVIREHLGRGGGAEVTTLEKGMLRWFGRLIRMFILIRRLTHQFYKANGNKVDNKVNKLSTY